MNARNNPGNKQQDDQLSIIAWQKHQAWRNQRADQADAVDFDKWLDSPECLAWLEGGAERHELEYGVGSASAGCGYH